MKRGKRILRYLPFLIAFPVIMLFAALLWLGGKQTGTQGGTGLNPSAGIISRAVARAGQIYLHRRQIYAHRHVWLRGIPYSRAAFFHAIETGDFSTVRAFLKSGISPNLRDGKYGIPLNYAVKNKDKAMADLLIAAGADVNGDGYYLLPLHVAIGDTSKDMIEFLISKGANVNGWSPDVGNWKRTPLCTAVEGRRKDMVSFLLSKGADPRDDPSLVSAAYDGDKDIAELLLAHGANLESYWGRADDTPLSAALRSGHREMAALLISKGAKVDSKSIDGGTPLMVATELHHYDMAKWLISKGANVNACNNSGYTALDYASTPQITSLLLSHGARKGDHKPRWP